MSYASTQFPVDQFLECIRNNRTNSQTFIQQANHLNTEWIYQIIKHCHNSILEMKEHPTTKLSALYIIRDLIQTCQIPCVNLVQVFILPIVYEIAIQKPQEKGQRRGSTFFHLNGKSSRIPNIQETGIKFLALCPQILYAMSIIKPRRTFQNKQLKQKSQSFDYYQKFKKYGIYGTPTSPSQLKSFNSQFVKNGSSNFLNNLKAFNKSTNDYCEYFVTKIMQSLESDNNSLFNANQTVSTLSNELDIRKLLKHGDTIITSPLIEQMINKLKILQSFMAKKNCLSLLIDFIKWGDVEGFVKLCIDGVFINIGKRIAEVQGNKGTIQGQQIYPQVKGQRDGKRKFYTQYLKSLQVLAKCLQNQNLPIQQTFKITDLYNYLKKQKKFQFPQNLMLKRIQSDFKTNFTYNQQRNDLLLRRIQQEGNSGISKGSKRSFGSKQANNSILIAINKDLQDCLQQVFKLTSNESKLSEHMNKIVKLKIKYQEQIQKLNEDQIPQNQINQLLDNGHQITKLVQSLEGMHKQYRNKKLTFEQFKLKHAQMTKDMYGQQSQQQKMQDQKMASEMNLKQSHEQVVNSFHIKKSKIHNNATSPTLKVSKQKTNNGFQIPKSNIISQTSPISGMNTFNIIESGSQQFAGQLLNKGKQDIIKNPYQLAIPNSINQQKSINNYIISNISEKNNVNKQQSQISKSQKSQASLNKPENVEKNAYKVKQISKINQKSSIINQSNKNSFVSSNQENFNYKNSVIQQQNKKQNVEFHKYTSPPSFSLGKNVLNGPNIQATNNKNFAETSPILNTKLQSQSPKNSFIKKQTQNKVIEKSSNIQINNGNNFILSNEPQNKIISLESAQKSVNNSSFNKQILKNATQPNFANYNLRNLDRKREQIKNKTQNYFEFNSSNIKLSQENELNNRKQNNSIHSSNSQVTPVTIIKKQSNKNSRISQNSQFKTCKDRQNHSKLSLQNSKHQSIKSNKSDKKDSLHQSYKSETKYYSIINKESSNVNRNNNYYFREDDDFIKQPQCKPLQNSYYGYHDIENDIKSSSNPQFKNCFQIDKHLISSPRTKNNLKALDIQLNKSRSNGSLKSGMNQLGINPHEQYLIAKLNRQYEAQKDVETKQLNERVQQLKKGNSKLRNQLLLKRDDHQLQKSNSNSYQPVQFSRQKSQNSNSFVPSRQFASSGAAVGFLTGQQINQNAYNQFMVCLNNDRLKKSCLKNKSVIYRDQICQIGCMFNNTVKNTVTLLLYFTPSCVITNLSYRITRQDNIQTRIISQPFVNRIEENKQIKIEIASKLKNIGYKLPQITFQFFTPTQKKFISFYLPLTFNKYVNISRQSSLNSQQKILDLLSKNQQKLLKTSNILINNKVTTRHIIEQSKTNDIQININRDCFICNYQDQKFLFITNSQAKNQMVLQSLSLRQPLNLNSLEIMKYYLITFKKLINT